MDFRVAAPVIGYAERLATFVGGVQHAVSFGLAHSHRFFAKHVLAGAKRLNRLRCVQEYGGADIDGVHGRIGQRRIESFPRAYPEGGGFRGIAGDESVEAASRFGLDRGDDAARRDVADSDDDPVEHRGW